MKTTRPRLLIKTQICLLLIGSAFLCSPLRAAVVVESNFSNFTQFYQQLGGTLTSDGKATWQTGGSGYVREGYNNWVVPNDGSQLSNYVSFTPLTQASLEVQFNSIGLTPGSASWAGIGFNAGASGYFDGAGGLGFFISRASDGQYGWFIQSNGNQVATGTTNAIVNGGFNTLSLNFDATAGTFSAFVNTIEAYNSTTFAFASSDYIYAGFSSISAQSLQVSGFAVESIPEPTTSALLLTALGIGIAVKRGRKILH